MKTMRVVKVLALGALALALGACDWTMPGHDPNRTGFAPFEKDVTRSNVGQLQQMFSVPLTDGAGPPVIAGSRLYVTSGRALHSLDRITGAQRWVHTLPDGAAGAVPTATGPIVDSPGGRAIVGSLNGYLYDTTAEIDTKTGADRRSPGDISGAVVTVRDDRALIVNNEWVGSSGYAPTTAKVVPADDLAGSAEWSGLISVGGSSGSASSFKPTLGSNRLYGNLDGDLVAYDLNTPCTGNLPCVPAWSLPVAANTSVVLSVDEATVFAGTSSGRLVAVDTSTGIIRWTATLGDPVSATPVLAGGTLIVPTGSSLVVLDSNGCGKSLCVGTRYLLDARTAKVQSVVGGEVLYVALEGGRVASYDLIGCAVSGVSVCTPAWSASVPGDVTGGLAVANGRLYVGSAGAVTAFGLPPS